MNSVLSGLKLDRCALGVSEQLLSTWQRRIERKNMQQRHSMRGAWRIREVPSSTKMIDVRVNMSSGRASHLQADLPPQYRLD